MSASVMTGGLAAAPRRYAQPRRVEETGHCELCSMSLPGAHRHLLEVASRKILSACDACALPFHDVVGGRFKLIPQDARRLAGIQLDDADWEALALPIALAFYFYSTPASRMMALYPSPAGATESLLPLAMWESLMAENPALAHMEPDIEALLVNRAGEAPDYFIVPIDRCFELAGLIRRYWAGLSGGETVWREIGSFFERLEPEVHPSIPEAAHA